MDARLRHGLLILGLGFTGLIGTPPAAAQSATPLPEGVTPDMVAQGRKLFQGAGLCLACHGATAKGNIGPDLTDATWLHEQAKGFDGLVALITAGIPLEDATTGQLMPPRGGSAMNPKEIRAVAAYVWTLSRGGKP